MAESVSLISLYLMLAALALLAVRWTLHAGDGAPRHTVFLSAAGMGTLIVLLWMLAGWWAGDARPASPSLAGALGTCFSCPWRLEYFLARLLPRLTGLHTAGASSGCTARSYRCSSTAWHAGR